MKNSSTVKLVTVITEEILAGKILDLSKKLGAKGFTISEVRGIGSVHRHSSEVPDQKIKIEILCREDLARDFLEKISERYFKDYSIIAYSHDVDVLREGKFQ